MIKKNKALIGLMISMALISILINCGSSGSSSNPITTVYASGYSRDNSALAVPGYWKNGTWNSLPSTYSAVVNSIAISGTDVYAAGYKSISPSVKASGYWKNGVWNV